MPRGPVTDLDAALRTIVDEGLLGLTSFQTPDLHGFFYKKEALGVTTWDLFDDVVGAYGGELERLLALGGGEDRAPLKEQDEKRRFPPVVRFLGRCGRIAVPLVGPQVGERPAPARGLAPVLDRPAAQRRGQRAGRPGGRWVTRMYERHRAAG